MTKHRAQFADTDPHAMEVWLDLLRRMSPGEKLGATLNASQFLLQLYEMGHLPRDLVIRAYGWDPEADGDPR
ncbi:MAG: hypothetical protein JWO19_2502 [Bryobacterales bacterium]|nr:hypothetical protein [Bryobacterales bacterium]